PATSGQAAAVGWPLLASGAGSDAALRRGGPASRPGETTANPRPQRGEGNMAEGNLIPTGIAGLDDILRGGVPRGNILLVEGAAGTGKTLLGVEFVYRGITQHNEPGIIVSFEVAPQKLIRDAASFGWDLETLAQQNQLKII